MPSYMRYISSCVIFMGFLLIWFFGVYQFFETKIQKHMHHITNTHDTIQQLRLLCEQKDKLEKAYTLLQSHELLTKNDDAHAASLNCVLTILESIRSSGMYLISYTVDQMHAKQLCSMYPLHITMRGTMKQLITCLQKLETLKIALSCTRFNFVRNDATLYTITLDLKCAFMHKKLEDPST